MSATNALEPSPVAVDAQAVAELACIQEYVDRMVAAMMLGEWTVEVMDDDGSDGAWARIARPDGLWCGIATLKLARDAWWKLSADLRRRIICHELMHLHLTPYMYLSVRHDDTEYVGEEQMNERITNALSPHMPMPPVRPKP